MTLKNSLLLTALFTSTTVLAACSDSASPEPEPDVSTLELTVGPQTITVDVGTGACTGCPLVLANGATVTARFLDAEGEPDPIAVPGDFRLNVIIPTNTAGLTFTLNTGNPFSGTFAATGTASTVFNVTFELFHVEENHDELSRTVAVIVQ